MSQGFIKLQRDIQGTFIHENPVYFKAYCDILFNVNWEAKKVLIGSHMMFCDIGEALYSLDSWAKIFGKKWDKNKVRRFFIKLENANVIRTQNERKTTRLKLVNIECSAKTPNAKRTKNERNPTPTKELRIKNTTTEQDFKEPKPYGIVEAREGIERLFGNTQVQVKNIQKAFKEQTGFELDSGKALQGIVTFLQKGMEETYKGRIKDDEKLRSLLLRWITNQKSFDYLDSVIKVQKKQDDNFITLEQHLEKYCKPKEIERFKKMGKYEIWLKRFETETFKFKNLAKVYSNPTITAAFLFELCFLPYGRNIGGTKPEAKLKSFKRFFEEQSSYNKNKGEIRDLFKKWAKVKA